MNDSSAVSTNPLLTVAIPTYNRANYLTQNLEQLQSELAEVPGGLVEILVSDNCSPDSTSAVVEKAKKGGVPLRYIRNEENIGWALNFIQCFDLARGKYVLLLGDDDLFIDGALSLLLSYLSQKDYGVVCLRPYGYDEDFRREYPGGNGRELVYYDPNKFIIAISQWFTLTSACVLNKGMLSKVDCRQFITTDLATFHLVLRASLAAEKNLHVKKYLIASKRQNSSSYEYAKVFVDQFWRIIDAHMDYGLSPEAVRVIERDKMLSYYPFYLLDLRLSGRGDLKLTYDCFAVRFRDRWLFKYWLVPIIRLPRPLAVVWGGLATLLGRLIGGDARRGLQFVRNRLIRMIVK